MPIEYVIDEKADVLRVRRHGHISTHDEELACRERSEDPRIRPGMSVLVDCREVEPPDSTETIKYLADCVARNSAALQCGPVAIVVASDVEYGMARMYLAYTDLVHPDTEVFRDLESAEAWLRRPVA